MRTASPSKLRVAAATACAHCGLPVGAAPVGTGPFFCCTGCAVVYDALHADGFGATYYQLREQTGGQGEACPAPTDVDALLLSEMDTDVFLHEHTTLLEDGTRSMDLFLDGVHCAACVWLVERMPREVEGVLSSRLDLPRARLTIRWIPEAVALSEVARWLARFGYIAHPARGDQGGQRSQTAAERKLLIRMGVAWALAGNVMLLAFALYSGLDFASNPDLAQGARWLSLLLAVPAVLYGGQPFFARAWASLQMAWRSRSAKHLHMDMPIALGILVGTGHSAWATVTGQGDVWFDSITVLIAALLTARWLQLRSRRLAGDATERLLALIPSMVRRIRPDGTRDLVPAADIEVGDLVDVPAGEVIPIDGTVVTGTSTLNNAVLTGESRPLPLVPGMAVSAGATNVQSPIEVQVDAAGDATRVGKLLAWVREASEQRAPVVLLANRISSYFVLGVFTLALLTAGIWWFIDPSMMALHVVALLVITCPCALGMATPLAMAVASGRAARHGIFIKSEETTQLLTSVDTVVLDKTGTLTQGDMLVADWEGDAEAIGLAIQLERHSNHPIADALVRAWPRFAQACDADELISAIDVVAGQGLRGTVGGRRLAVGRPDWVRQQCAAPSFDADAVVARFLRQAYTPIAIGMDGRVVACVALGDPIRPDAANVLARFAQEGKTVHVLSGDHPDVVAAVADELGVPAARCHGHASPESKRAFIEALQASGHTVAMVGDGVNDAAALQAADVGIAVHGGSTASLVAADVFLTRAGTTPLADLFQGAGAVMQVIRRNLALSLGYNVLGASAAMLGLVTPLFAAIAMPISSLVVVASSILQRSFRRSAFAAESVAPPARPPQPAPIPRERITSA